MPLTAPSVPSLVDHPVFVETHNHAPVAIETQSQQRVKIGNKLGFVGVRVSTWSTLQRCRWLSIGLGRASISGVVIGAALRLLERDLMESFRRQGKDPAPWLAEAESGKKPGAYKAYRPF